MQPDEWVDSRFPELNRESHPRAYDHALNTANAVAAAGCDLSVISREDIEPETFKKILEKSPAMRLANRLMGANASLNAEGLGRLNGQSPNSTALDGRQFISALVKRKDLVLRSWQCLREWRGSGKLSGFREVWLRMAEEERTAWLQQNFPKLPQHAHSGVYAWLEHQPSDPPPSQNPVMYRLLNTDMLAHDDILPNLLDFRAETHPAYLLDLDGRLTPLGTFCGSLLSIRVSGMVRFPMQQLDDGYEFSWDEAASPYSCQFRDQTPTLALHKLEAQQRMYEWFVKCVQLLPTAIMGPAKRPCGNPTTDVDTLPVLTRSLLSDYHRSHDRINIMYLLSLATSALDEARFDLAQVRKYPDVWQERLKSTEWQHACRALFARIDTFTILSANLRSLRQQQEGGEMRLTEGERSLRAIAAVFYLSKSLLSEVMRQLPSRAPDKLKSNALSKLLQLLQENDVMIQIMPLLDVMMVIHDEAKCESAARMPHQLMRVLHDLSVLVACEWELGKHYRFVNDISSYAKILDELEKERKKARRPCNALFQSALEKLDDHTQHKLNTHIRDANVDLSTRHRTFWTLVDDALRKTSDPTTEGILSEILESTPVDVATPVDCGQVITFRESAQPAEVTQTKVRRSKGRTPQNERPEALLGVPAPSQSLEPRPVVTLKTQLDFWDSILAQSSESRSDLKWDDFCRAMAGIGYQICPVIGSSFKFHAEHLESTITFHKPHSNVLPHIIARRQWLDRLTSRFDLQRESETAVKSKHS